MFADCIDIVMKLTTETGSSHNSINFDELLYWIITVLNIVFLFNLLLTIYAPSTNIYIVS